MVLLTCSYLEQEFIRVRLSFGGVFLSTSRALPQVGYYVKSNYRDEALR